MRVIIITSSSNRSGGTRQAIYQAQGLQERGHEVTLCLPHDSELWELPEAHDNPLWHALPKNSAVHRADIESLFPSQQTPTIVHAFHNKAVKRVAWWGLFWRNRRLACVAHRGVIYRPGNPFPYLSPAMKAVIPNSEACARTLWCCPSRKIHVVPNAIPESRTLPNRTGEEMRTELDIPAGTLTFVYVGNNNPAKGTELLLRAFAQLKETAYRLILIGPTPDSWQPVCHELGIEHSVRLVGRTEQVSNYLQIADAFVFPSRTMDSAPNTLLEAIRMGLPVVATTVGGVPEIARGNGLLVPPDNIPALTAAMSRMAADPEQRTRWREQSEKQGRIYTVTARCEALEAIYQSVL